MSNLNEVSTCKHTFVYVLQKNRSWGYRHPSWQKNWYKLAVTVTKTSIKKEEYFDRKIKKQFPLFTGLANIKIGFNEETSKKTTKAKKQIYKQGGFFHKIFSLDGSRRIPWFLARRSWYFYIYSRQQNRWKLYCKSL